LLQQTQSFRAIATRYDKLAINFLAEVYLASAVILLNRKQAVVERLLLDRIPAGTAIASILVGAQHRRQGYGIETGEEPNHRSTDHNIDHG
jgi:hypothetical protein